MMSKLRFLLLPVVIATLVFTGVFSPAVHVTAQAAQCFGLSADDCALAQSVPAQKPTSFNMAYELTFNGTGPQGNSGDISVKGNGALAIDPAAMAGLSGGDMQAAKGLTMQNTLSWTTTNKGETKTGNFEFRILNGTLYFQGDNATQGKWKSVDLQKAASARAGNMPMQANPAQIVKLIGALRQLANADGAIRAERTADTTVEGQQIATFVYHFDLQKILSSDQAALLIKTLAAQNPAVQRMKDAQLKLMLTRFATMFQNSTFSITRMVGVTDKVSHGFGVDMVLNIDPKDMAMMQAMMPRSSVATEAATSAQPVTANLHFLVTLSGIGTKVTVTAPDGATPLSAPVATQAAQ